MTDYDAGGAFRGGGGGNSGTTIGPHATTICGVFMV